MTMVSIFVHESFAETAQRFGLDAQIGSNVVKRDALEKLRLLLHEEQILLFRGSPIRNRKPFERGVMRALFLSLVEQPILWKGLTDLQKVGPGKKE